MKLSDDVLQLIRTNKEWRAHRVAKIQTPDGLVLVKGQRQARSALRFKPMSMLAGLTGNPLLAPVPALGGAAAQNVEVRRLLELAKAGVNVPRVWHQDPEFIVLEFLPGDSLQHHLRQTPEASLGAFEQGLQNLQHVHDKGQYLSQAFTRNIMMSNGALWFIDFEDDPLQVMSLADAQARDWLAYLLSSIWITHAPSAGLMKSWRSAFAALPAATSARVFKTAGRLAWLRHLPETRTPWGRDVVTLQAWAEFLYRWQAQADRI